MASRALKHRATYEDLLQVPDHLVAEILDGDLYASPRPAMPHSRVCSALEIEIGGPFDRGRGGPGGWWILFEPELHFDTEVLVPDLAGWRRERLPTIPDVAFMSLAPDWICEVLSPSTERIDRALKLPIYGKYGVRHAWLVNPASRTFEIDRRVEEAWTLVGSHADDSLVRAEPFDAVELDLLVLWGESRSAREG